MLVEGKINGIDCVLLARHGRKHSIMPSNVNYRANIWALKNVGCTHVIVSTATGSLQEHIRPGDIVIVDNFIDRTTKRNQTFYDGKELSPFGVCHLPMEPAFCDKTRDIIIQTACDLGIVPSAECVTRFKRLLFQASRCTTRGRWSRSRGRGSPARPRAWRSSSGAATWST